MNRTLKWILYVLLGLVALAVVALIFYAIFGWYGYGMMRPELARPGVWMWEHMRVGYSPVRTIFGGLLSLGVFLLVVLGIIALVAAIVRGNRTIPPAPPSAIATPERPCPNCGRMTLPDWKTCPYCGTALA
ncbi:MAG: hypothetical protein A2136_02055 [Chloroflexi bacterium RBG_16_54_11]|nr:MAG: hypothetical protein A2136_02055 [Chloroflexi bacterium RBG_16_54_11]